MSFVKPHRCVELFLIRAPEHQGPRAPVQNNHLDLNFLTSDYILVNAAALLIMREWEKKSVN